MVTLTETIKNYKYSNILNHPKITHFTMQITHCTNYACTSIQMLSMSSYGNINYFFFYKGTYFNFVDRPNVR